MRKIKINFSDFWGGFLPTDNYFYNLLKDEFDIEISNDPDYLFYSVFGQNHLNYKCKKIFYTGENIQPDMNYCDYAFSFDYLDDPRNYRLPHYLLYPGYYELANEKKIEDWMSSRNFCCFVASNPNSPFRNKFVEELSKYKKVDCGGSVMNNIGFKVKDKLEFQKNYKFSIAFENGAYRPNFPGYSTEKLPQSMQANTIPIYCGNPLINLEFNTDSFINYIDGSMDEVIDRVIELDRNRDKYLEMLKTSWFENGIIPDNNRIENIKSFLYKIFE